MTAFATPPDLELTTRAWRDRRAHGWQRRYAQRLVVSDLLIVALAVLAAALASDVFNAELSGPSWLDPGAAGVGYVVVCLVVVALWTAALAATGSRSYRAMGVGSGEFVAVVQSTVAVLVVLALVAISFRIDFSRQFMLIALTGGLLGLVGARFLWRIWLRGRRRQGEFVSRALIVGSIGSATQIAAELGRHPGAGYRVVGATLSDAGGAGTIAGDVPVHGGIESMLAAVEVYRADTVIVTDGHNLPPGKLRELSWSLEPGRQHLVMAPSLTDVAGPRIHARPVAGLPLVQVETPRYEGMDRVLKRAFDLAASGLLLLLLCGPLLAIALAVVTTSPGGVFFAHERIGKRGKPFRMLKFRSMEAGADNRLSDLLAQQGTAERPLFKITNDPRITPLGQFLRRYSVDEIPQLINVLRGEMSLVGPRPQVAREVALYDNAASRRLFVKPGMTGLWQVSGRSNLGWDESVRLDLYYVENWSTITDLMILFKTIKAVVGKDGAV